MEFLVTVFTGSGSGSGVTGICSIYFGRCCLQLQAIVKLLFRHRSMKAISYRKNDASLTNQRSNLQIHKGRHSVGASASLTHHQTALQAQSAR